jgi:hypothetical protein
MKALSGNSLMPAQDPGGRAAAGAAALTPNLGATLAPVGLGRTGVARGLVAQLAARECCDAMAPPKIQTEWNLNVKIGGLSA